MKFRTVLWWNTIAVKVSFNELTGSGAAVFSIWPCFLTPASALSSPPPWEGPYRRWVWWLISITKSPRSCLFNLLKYLWPVDNPLQQLRSSSLWKVRQQYRRPGIARCSGVYVFEQLPFFCEKNHRRVVFFLIPTCIILRIGSFYSTAFIPMWFSYWSNSP